MAKTVQYQQDLGGGIRLMAITIPDPGSRLYTVQLLSNNKSFTEHFDIDTRTVVDDVLGLTAIQLHIIFNAIEQVN